jgi:hypothetical protein
MAEVKVYGTLVPVNKEFPMGPVTLSEFAKGGYRTVETLADLDRYLDPEDLIDFSEEGMLAFVKENKKTYRLDLVDDVLTWVENASGGGSPLTVVTNDDGSISVNEIKFVGISGVIFRQVTDEPNTIEALLDHDYVIDEGEIE